MLFRRKPIEKESNVAVSPEFEPKKESFKGVKVFFFIWNILSITLYSAYTLFITYKMTERTFLSKVIIYLLWAYAIIFVLLILISVGSRKKMKYRLKNYQSATNFLRYSISIINFILSIITAISAFITTGTTNISAVAYAVLSLVVTFFLILFEVAKIIVRKNIPLIKQNFLELRDKPVKKLENND
ncbi:MAG: hypothetical protein IKB06_00130 [Clostridia bacterium]|nr:hypothetical protein [Clostridia bacterium]